MAGIRTAGIDWASEAHEVCLGEEGRVVARFSVAHHESGIRDLIVDLGRLGVGRVAIERPDGILVERLLATGQEVLAIHPNQLKAARPRYAVAPHGKSDRSDAYVLAEDLVAVRVGLANQLRTQLEAFWPGALIFGALDNAISLTFIARYPSPRDAQGPGVKRMAAFLERHRYSGRTDAAVLVERMKAAATGTAGAAECEARRAVVLGLVAALGPVLAEIGELDAKIRAALRAHPAAAVFAPLFRSAKTTICPATLIAEIGDCRGRYPTEAALAADAGMSPVALESGKLRVATFRRA